MFCMHILYAYSITTRVITSSYQQYAYYYTKYAHNIITSRIIIIIII